MATGAAITAGVVGIAGSISSSRKAEDSMESAQNSLNQGIGAITKYAEQAGLQGQEALEYAQGMVTDWEETFGGIEDNLSSYYNNLDPAKYASQYKSTLNSNIDKQLGQMNDQMAASGLQTAGMQQQTAKEAAFAKATGGAQADLMAEDKVASMKQGFLNTGAGQKATANANNINARGNLANMATQTGRSISGLYGNQAGLNQQQSGQYSADASGFLSGGMNNLAGGIKMGENNQKAGKTFWGNEK